MQPVPTPDESVRLLFEARSVAIVGASERPGAPAGFVVRNLLACGYKGRILPVHPSAESVFGLAAARSLTELADVPDAVLIGVAAERVVEVLDEAGGLGIRAAVVLASGFAELGPEGRERQARLGELARRHGMALCGPNCLGVHSPQAGLALFSSRLVPGMKQGGMAIVSHSGAAAIALANAGRLGVSRIVSAGNAAATDIPDYLRYLAGDPLTRIAALVVEEVRDPGALAAAAGLMHAAGKPVLALRAGRSAKGAAVSAAHTGALAGADEAYLAFFRRAGIHAVEDMDDLLESAVLMTGDARCPRSSGVALVGVSGGGLAHVSDVAEAEGLALPDLAPATLARLGALLPPYATPQNPLDVTGIAFGEPALYRACLDALAADPAIGLVAAVQDVPAGLDADGAAEYLGIAEAVAGHAAGANKPLILLSNVSAGPHPAFRSALDRAGVPVLHGTRPGLRAVRRLLDGLAPEPAEHVPPLEPLPRWVERLERGDLLLEREAKAFLADHGLPVTRERLARSAAEAAEAAVAIGCPVAMKVESPDLPHKTEAGGVRLGIGSPDAAAAAFAEIRAEVARRTPGARIEGVLVQEMVSGSIEAILGLTRCEPFGLALVLGAGGVLVEIARDSALTLLPLGPEGALRLIARTRLSVLLAGFRGRPAGDAGALADAAVALGRIALCYARWIEATDLNPVAVLPEGQGLRILDALVVPRRAGASPAGPPATP